MLCIPLALEPRSHSSVIGIKIVYPVQKGLKVSIASKVKGVHCKEVERKEDGPSQLH